MMSTLYTKRLNWKARIVNTNQEYKKFAFLKKIWFNVCAMRKRSKVERSNKYPWNSFLCKNFSLHSRFLQNLATNHQSGTKNGKKLVDIWKGRHVIWDQYNYLSRITWQAPKYLPNQAFENTKILSNEDFSCAEEEWKVFFLYCHSRVDWVTIGNAANRIDAVSRESWWIDGSRSPESPQLWKITSAPWGWQISALSFRQ